MPVGNHNRSHPVARAGSRQASQSSDRAWVDPFSPALARLFASRSSAL